MLAHALGGVDRHRAGGRVALSADDELGAAKLLASVAITMAVFWMAHVYAGAVQRSMEHGGWTTRAELREIAASEWPIVEAAAGVLLALLLGALGVIDRDTAVWLAIVLGMADLAAWGWRIGRQWNRTPAASLGLAAANACIALPIVALNVFIHH